MYRVLSIDGGGIRGIIPAVWLQHLESRLGSPLAAHFDLVAGTSTGAILAAGIASGIPSARLVDLYEKQGAQIFPPRGYDEPPTGLREMFSKLFGPKYLPEPLEAVLKEHFSILGEPLKLGSVKSHCLITGYDVLMRRVRLFRSWREEDTEINIWEACKASCSAPTYFPAHVMTLADVQTPVIDGGVVANNPASLALAEAVVLNDQTDLGALEKCRQLLLLSLGTGNLTKPISVDAAQQMGGIDWAFPILDVVFDGSALANDHICRTLLKDDSYFRFQVTLRAATELMDDASEININELKCDAQRFIEDDGSEFERVVALLHK